MLTEIRPLAIWDVRLDSWWKPVRPARTDWLRKHSLPADDLYRIEFFLADAPFARLFCYHRNAEGRRHLDDAHIPGPHDHDACKPAVEEPRDVPLSQLPPRELLYL